MDQLALFPDTAATGTGQPFPWPTTEPQPEPETTTPADPNQIAFGEEDTP
jgi:hypothetical protein